MNLEEAINQLTPSDQDALLAAVEYSPYPDRFVQVGQKVSHYRWFRLVSAGLAENMPPRLKKGVATIVTRLWIKRPAPETAPASEPQTSRDAKPNEERE